LSFAFPIVTAYSTVHNLLNKLYAKNNQKIKLNPFNSLTFSLLLSPNQKLTFALLWRIARITLGRNPELIKKGRTNLSNKS